MAQFLSEGRRLRPRAEPVFQVQSQRQRKSDIPVNTVRPEEFPLIGCGESALLFLSGLHLIGQGPLHWTGQSALVHPQHRMLLSSPKQPHRHPQNPVGPRVWAPHGPVKLMH